jgi:hypothetical protein
MEAESDTAARSRTTGFPAMRPPDGQVRCPVPGAAWVQLIVDGSCSGDA